MAIPNVDLNIDPRGYAGSIVRSLGSPGQIGSGTGLSEFLKAQLERQLALREKLAQAQLDAMKQETSQRRRAFRDSRSAARPTWRERLMTQDQMLGGAAQREALQARGSRARAENAARGEAIRMAGTPGAPGPLGFNRYSLMNALKQFSGGETGRAGFTEQDIQSLGAGRQPSLARAEFALRRQADLERPNYGAGGIDPAVLQSYFLARGISPTTGGALGEERLGTSPGRLPTGQQRPNEPGMVPRYSLKKGTLPGTLPTDQKAKLHKGEVVLSADQVDEPLMSYLMHDKLRKMQTGQMDGKGTGPGRSYAKGSLPSYRRGNIIAPPDDFVGPPSYLANPEGYIHPAAGPPTFEEAAESSPMLRLIGLLTGRSEEPVFRGGIDASPLAAPTEPVEGGAGMISPRDVTSFVAQGVGLPEEEIARFTEPSASEAPASPTTMALPSERETSEPEARPSLVDRMLEEARASGQPKASTFDINTKEYRDTQNAAMQERALRSRAEMMQNFLMKAALDGDISPEMYKSMTDNIKRYDQLADMAAKRREKAENIETAQKEAAEDRVQEAYRTGIEAQVSQEQKRLMELGKQARELDNEMDQIRRDYYKADDEQRETMIQDYAQKYRELEAVHGDPEVSKEYATIVAMWRLGELSEEEAVERLSALMLE